MHFPIKQDDRKDPILLLNEIHSNLNESDAILNEIHSNLNETHAILNEIHSNLNETHAILNEIHSNLNENHSTFNKKIFITHCFCALYLFFMKKCQFLPK